MSRKRVRNGVMPDSLEIPDQHAPEEITDDDMTDYHKAEVCSNAQCNTPPTDSNTQYNKPSTATISDDDMRYHGLEQGSGQY